MKPMIQASATEPPEIMPEMVGVFERVAWQKKHCADVYQSNYSARLVRFLTMALAEIVDGLARDSASVRVGYQDNVSILVCESLNDGMEVLSVIF